MQNEIKQQVQNFISHATDDPKIIVVYGPTACGKTGLSINIALFYESEDWSHTSYLLTQDRYIVV